MSLRHIYKGIKHFNVGWSDAHDKQQTGSPRDSINDETIARVWALYSQKIVGSQFQTFTQRWKALPNAD